MMVELLHSIGWDEDLKTRITSCERFRDFQKSTTCVFLQINVVLFVLFEHYFRTQLSLDQMVRINRFKFFIEIDHCYKMLAELGCSGQRHQNLIFASIGADFGNFNEPTSCVFLNIKIESLGLQNKSPGG